MIWHDIIGVVFRWINFFVLVGLGVYFFRKYVLGMVKQNIQDAADHKALLLREAQEALHDKDDIEASLERQKELYQKLNGKLQTWNQHYTEFWILRDQEKQKIKLALEKKGQEQREALKNFYIKRDIMEDAIEDARLDLMKKYADQDTGNAYIGSILSILKKSAS